MQRYVCSKSGKTCLITGYSRHASIVPHNQRASRCSRIPGVDAAPCSFSKQCPCGGPQTLRLILRHVNEQPNFRRRNARLGHNPTHGKRRRRPDYSRITSTTPVDTSLCTASTPLCIYLVVRDVHLLRCLSALLAAKHASLAFYAQSSTPLETVVFVTRVASTRGQRLREAPFSG
jgi:hypothetical protein